ncbi:Serine/threonine-protein kinase/endoribonuclease IRE1a isoform B [Glycine soja]|uniref:non-specific serine/threonine protein kinase n=1 Tax=Glycine soja TaxID=3848 RepID=A0A445M3W3_GLYSO|nr:Serine/threonine-protein kinase/endoribonuclease IRE1a isoform B [Glycine soja]
MKCRVSIFLLSLILLFFFFFFFFFSLSASQSQQLSLPSLPAPSLKPATALVAALDGTMYLVDSVSGRVFWSFSTGSPIYHHSYRAPINDPEDNNVTGLIECGDDWELIVHDARFGKTRLSESIANYVALTPTETKEGASIFGSKKDTMFEVDAKTGALVRTHYDLDNASNVVLSGDDRLQRVTTTKNNELVDPAQLDSPEFLLKITRSDYVLKSLGKAGIVLWTMNVAEFKARLICQHNENPSGRDSFDAEDGYVVDRGLDFAMPYACWDMKLNEVYRQRKNFLLHPADPGRLSGIYQENIMLPFHTSELMLPSQPDMDGFILGQGGNMMLPLPISNSLPSLQQKLDFCESNDNVAMLPWPLMEISTQEEVDPKKVIEWSTTLPLILFTIFLGFFVFYHYLVVTNKDQNRELNSRSLPPKKKKARKSVKNNITIDNRQDKPMSSAEEDKLARKETNTDTYTQMQVDGRRIGKLFVSNKEIAKGSNGTIVFEGTYEGRVVAVKRLVKAHHDVAHKEIQNLIASDRHPNIVRWDVVSGLVHLHELGIIHRDLKPQNVLILKEKSLCAKLSDMGISKRLLEDMSSLGHTVTGCGSSGWQAPEQLVQGRQTRAVDLFSLGCILFFCMTGGRHPFGERLERDFNIVKNQKDLFLVEFIPEADDLISCLLNPNPDLRLTAIEVLHHPLFWSSEMRLSFLRDVSDRVELEDREIDSDLLKALESIAPLALGAKWDEKLDPDFITNIGRYRRYKYDSVRHLLRVMRNKLNHYRELPQEIQELIGPVPEGFNDYFASRFPRLLIEVYKVIYKSCKDDECFQRYFRYIN